ncbi:hypothetical protein FRC06_003503 [Ceratobasidium sp. 370]|nr:hypothetical protein FRC06_003503 [Ceratobasidium sp. 370]
MRQNAVQARRDRAPHRAEPQNQGRAEPNREPEAPRDSEDEDVPEDAPPEVLREALMQAQIARNEHRQANIEKDREISKLQDQIGRKKARSQRFQEKTPHDSKYADAGKRCAVMQMLWIPTGMYDLEPDPAYAPELRYDKAQPNMSLLGEQTDILASMATHLREDFLKLEHFQYKFDKAHGTQRRNSVNRVRKCGSLIYGCKQGDLTCDTGVRAANASFQELLGFNAEGRKPSERYPPLAPMLYKDLRGGNNSNIRLFRHEYVFKTFSAMVFGASSLRDPQISRHQGQPVLAKVLGVRVITPGAIAAAAILARWCISPDETFTEEGDKTGIQWFEDYRAYKKIMVEGVRKETQRVEQGRGRGPFLKLMSEWNQRFFPHSGEAEGNGDGNEEAGDDAPGVAQALEEIDQFVDGDEEMD